MSRHSDRRARQSAGNYASGCAMRRLETTPTLRRRSSKQSKKAQVSAYLQFVSEL